MDRLLIAADDFTGALDTGVQFAAWGARTCVVTRQNGDHAALDRDCQVLVVDTQSRHMTAEQAYDAVFQVVKEALAAGFTHIYKKTDSALRGNVGAELAAVLDASGRDDMAFFPAFPKMKRITRDGVQYVDGVPVAESVFGSDPFEPVCHSRLAEVLGEQTDRPVNIHAAGDGDWTKSGIQVYDASTDDDLRRSARVLCRTGRLDLLGGCAGFAAVLPDMLDIPAVRREAPSLSGKLLTVCGSVNPITIRQLDMAERAGAVRIRLTPEQMLSPEWVLSRDGERAIRGWLSDIESASNAIVECGVDDQAATDEYAARLGLSLDQTRRRIASAMGGVLQRLLDMGLERDLLVTGGDTLLAFMERIGQSRLVPLGESALGVVLSQIEYGAKRYNLMSKSGGYGVPSLLLDLRNRQTDQNDHSRRFAEE